MLKKIINRILKFFQTANIPSKGKVVYLTFDDGPEPDITEFVLKGLEEHGFKATFFCRGDNAEKYPELLSMIRKQGHTVANHTYSHLHAYDVAADTYISDVEKADALLHTPLFRPPKGNLTLKTFLGLRKKFRIVYWALNSEDSARDNFEYGHSYRKLISDTKPGDVILFHFCHRHEKETRKILPDYLDWLQSQGYRSIALNTSIL